MLKTECDGRTIGWDDSALLAQGVLRVASVTGIESTAADAATVDVYSADGIKLRAGVAREDALDGLAAGVYVIDGVKIVKQ